MSTVIGLLKAGRSLPDLTAKLEAAGCALDQIKILSQPVEVHTLLDKKALAKCELSKCLVIGAAVGLAFFMPIGFIGSLLGCLVFQCSPLIWLSALGGLSLIGALAGAAGGCFFGADRFERNTHIYTEGVGWGNKLVVVTVDTPDSEARLAGLLQQERALAVKILHDGE